MFGILINRLREIGNDCECREEKNQTNEVGKIR